MNKLRWVFELVDRMSAPATAAARSVDRVTQSVDRVTPRAARASTSMQRMGTSSATAGKAVGTAAASVRRVPAAATQAAASVSRLSAAMATAKTAASSLGPTFSMLGTAISRLGMAALAGSAAAVAAGFVTARNAVDALTRREAELRSFTALLGGDQAGALQLRGRIDNLADLLGIDPNEVSTGVSRLMTQGFSQVDALRIFQATTDIQALDVTGQMDTSRIVLAMSQIRSNGRLLGEEINQLAEAGLPMQAILEGIGDAAGISASEVRGMNGRIDAATAIQGILAGVSRTTGRELGGFAQEASMSLGGMMTRIQTAPERFFRAFADGAGPTSERMRGLASRLVDMLDPDSYAGQELMRMIASGFETAATMVERFITWITNPATKVELTAMWIQARTTFAGIADGISTVVGLWQQFGPSISQVASLIYNGMMGLGMGFDLFVVQPISRTIGIVQGVIGALASIPTRMQQLGTDIIMGLVRGMQAVASLPAQTIANAGQGVIESLATMLGIRSPSRVMMAMGEDTAEGFAMGIDGGRRGAIAPPDIGTLGAGVGAGGLFGAGGASVSIPIVVNVTGPADGQSIGEQIRAVLLPELARAFDGLAVEGGV